MPQIVIQGIQCSYRDLREGEQVLYLHIDEEDQYFRRQTIPFSEEETLDLAGIDYESRKGKYSKEQAAWVEREDKRMEYGEGVYCMINGSLTYLPASYWGYINYWLLEHDEYPDYREADRIFFLFMEYIYFETQVLAVTRGKGRRQGASSLGFYWMWWICGRNASKKGGSLSYNDTIAQQNFQEMFMKGLRALPPCFARDIGSKSENFVEWKKPKKGVMKKDEGLMSYADFLPNSVNSYDGGRNSFIQIDESGKYPKNNINTYWSKVFPTLKKGKRKLGMAYLPTTVNPANLGGEAYEQFWREADQNAINPNTKLPFGLNTRHKVVRYFVPATEGYAGCIDKYGNSVVDDPLEPIMGNDGEWITEGARTVILNERALKEGDQLLEHRRDFPLDEFDMFSFSFGTCEYNEANFRAQLKWLEANPQPLRRVRLYREQVTKKNQFGTKEEIFDEIRWMDDDAGGWLLFEPPERENLYDHRGRMGPLNTVRYSIGVDTIKSGFTEGGGSNGAICIFKKSHLVEEEEKGLKPVAIYLGKPRLMNHLFDEVLKACMWYGCKANFEIDAGTFHFDYFFEKDALDFLQWTPKIAIDPTKRHPLLKPGSLSGNPYTLAMELEVSKKYFDGTIPDGYNGNVHRVVFPIMLRQGLEYNHAARTKSDVIIALMMALLPCFGSLDYIDPVPRKPSKILPTYKIKMAS